MYEKSHDAASFILFCIVFYGNCVHLAAVLFAIEQL